MDDSTCTGTCVCRRVTDDRGAVSRRGVLAGSAAAAAALALGACAGSESATTPASSSPSPADASSTPTTAASQTPDAGSSGELLAGTEDFPMGGGVVVQTGRGPVVVTRPAEDQYLAFNARCPHAGCTVAEVLENTINCNCHGSTFDGSSGDLLGGPAKEGLQPVAIEVSDGGIYLA